jgi:hypothetical protein
MAKAKRTPILLNEKTTEWRVGQPLAFPSRKTNSLINRLARAAVREGLAGPLGLKRLKGKKK